MESWERDIGFLEQDGLGISESQSSLLREAPLEEEWFGVTDAPNETCIHGQVPAGSLTLLDDLGPPEPTPAPAPEPKKREATHILSERFPVQQNTAGQTLVGPYTWPNTPKDVINTWVKKRDAEVVSFDEAVWVIGKGFNFNKFDDKYMEALRNCIYPDKKKDLKLKRPKGFSTWESCLRVIKEHTLQGKRTELRKAPCGTLEMLPVDSENAEPEADSAILTWNELHEKLKQVKCNQFAERPGRRKDQPATAERSAKRQAIAAPGAAAPMALHRPAPPAYTAVTTVHLPVQTRGLPAPVLNVPQIPQQCSTITFSGVEIENPAPGDSRAVELFNNVVHLWMQLDAAKESYQRYVNTRRSGQQVSHNCAPAQHTYGCQSPTCVMRHA
eukprot:TRINITY_DN52596_c0_g1_i1.p1 TRINITY_DN52596_c0_g1~~TRINITY_DN52596_c0_g1_i1.p1  ORF type:complete len:386 (-),score=30.72 TRINITY_DN52596_c0_g1_i1:224-1381(-)